LLIEGKKRGSPCSLSGLTKDEARFEESVQSRLGKFNRGAPASAGGAGLDDPGDVASGSLHLCKVYHLSKDRQKNPVTKTQKPECVHPECKMKNLQKEREQPVKFDW